MEVTLKPETEKLIRERIAQGDYRDAAEFVDEAVHYFLDMDRAERELEALVQEGIDSGPAVEMTREDFEAIRREIHAQHGRKRD